MRNGITIASIAIALISASWAVYEIKHDAPKGGPMGGPPGAARPQAGGARPVGMQGGPAIAVITAAAQQRPMNVAIEAIGTANANEAVSVTAKAANIVTAVRFTDGQAVRAGDILVELDRGQVEAELAAANAAFEESRSQLNRSRELFNTQALSAAQYEQLEATMKANEARVDAAKARLADTYIRAPFSGHVGLRRVSLGALISPGTVVTTLDDTSSIKVDFAVPEVYVGQLRAGQDVTARTNAYPGRSFTGKIVSVDSRVDPTARAVTVRAVVPNRDGLLKPGMFLTVSVAQDSRPAVVIPEEALVPEQARQFVYVVDGQQVAKREVVLGRREPGYVEVTDGLAAGDRVVIEGTLKLRHGSTINDITAGPTVAAAPES